MQVQAPTSDAFFQSVLVSLINLLFTLFALWLVDRAGRKTLILAGTGLQFLSLALVGWFYQVHGSGVAILIFVMSFVAGHAFGNGVACWVIISEIYATKVRGRGMSIATTALWLVGYLVSVAKLSFWQHKLLRNRDFKDLASPVEACADHGSCSFQDRVETAVQEKYASVTTKR
jgi:MFS family permease